MFLYDVTDIKRLEKMKLDFFANASHELKSPLTTIIGYQQLIQNGILVEKEEIADATIKTVKEASRMNQIISEMLELAKLESDKKEDKNVLSISHVTDEILLSYNILLENKNITLVKDYNDFDVSIASNDLYHLIRNLIDNAVKYNKANGKIKITISDNTFVIEDTGIGISKEDQERIFERFYRVDKARSKENGGTGLGLSIVKHICINNNIKIEVSSALNEGTCFKLTF
jgi:two-component system phosphate regulon sensor histidine kinase PhoR